MGLEDVAVGEVFLFHLAIALFDVAAEAAKLAHPDLTDAQRQAIGSDNALRLLG